MSSESKENGTTRQRCSPEEKARIVRRYLKDHVALADLAEESGTPPAQIGQWVKAALKSLEEAFSGEPRKAARKHRKDLSKKEERIRQVVSDLSTEVLRLKKSWGPLGKTHGSTEVSQDVVQTVQFLKEKTRFPLRQAVRLIGLSERTYFRWARTKGKVARPEGTPPRCHDLLPEEKAAILAF